MHRHQRVNLSWQEIGFDKCCARLHRKQNFHGIEFQRKIFRCLTTAKKGIAQLYQRQSRVGGGEVADHLAPEEGKRFMITIIRCIFSTRAFIE